MQTRSLDHKIFEKLGYLTYGGKAWKRERTKIYNEMLLEDLAVHIGTLDSFGMGPVLQNLNYDFALVDESGQATEPNVLAIASSCQRLCLVLSLIHIYEPTRPY